MDIFSYVDTDTLVQVSQVCRRWAGLSRSRSLWAGVRVSAATDEDFLRMLRLLRRSGAVPPYSTLVIKTTAHPMQAGAVFKENGSHLEVLPSSPLMLALCLRELLKPTVTKLALTAYGCLEFTQMESFYIWDAVATNMTNLSALELTVYRSTRLLSSSYQWPEDQLGFRLNSISVSLRGWSHPRSPCPPLMSLLRLYGPQLSTLYLHPEDQQSALRWCSSYVTHLGAVLLPSLPAVLARMQCLANLSLFVGDSRQEVDLLRTIVDLENVHDNLLQLSVYAKFKEAKADAGAGRAGILAAITRCFRLRWLRLPGFGSVLADPQLGRAAFAGLLSGLSFLKWIFLDLSPCAVLLDDLNEGRSSLLESVANSLPDSLYLLMLDCGGLVCDRNACLSSTFRPASLRRVQGRATPLHIQVSHACHSMWRLPTQFIILPHAKDDYCEKCRDCSRLASSLKSYDTYCIADFHY